LPLYYGQRTGKDYKQKLKERFGQRNGLRCPFCLLLACQEAWPSLLKSIKKDEKARDHARAICTLPGSLLLLRNSKGRDEEGWPHWQLRENSSLS